MQQHLIPATLAVVGLLAIGSYQLSQQAAVITPEMPRVVDLALDNEAPAAVALAYSQKGNNALLDLDNKSNTPLQFTVPKDWKVQEVRRTDPVDVTATPRLTSFNRWTIPANAGVRFRIPDAPDGARLHHVSAQPLKVQTTIVDLERSDTVTNIQLIGDQVADLW